MSFRIHRNVTRAKINPAHLIERPLPEMRRRSQDTALIAWLTQLPDDTVGRMPELCTLSAWSLFVTEDLDSAGRRFNEVEKSFQQSCLESDL